jgi:hypothetical protein
MKKTLLIILLLSSSLILTGCTNPKNTSENTSSENNSGQSEPEEKGNVFDSIKDAMSRSLSLKCEYPAGESGKMVAYVKGNMIRMEGQWQTKNQTGMIIRDEKLYTWDLNKKEGIIMPIIKKEEDKPLSQEILDDLENNKSFCRPASVPDSMFQIPTDVKFSDISQMLEKVGQMTPGASFTGE